MNLLNELLFENPMMLEAKRFVRRFIGIRAGVVHVVIMVIVAAVYVLLMGMVAATRDIPITAVVYFQTALYCLVLPPMLQGSIAGEREKGTWESLLVAPVSKAQIVVGKYWGAFLVVLAIGLLMIPPLVWANTGSSAYTHPYNFDHAVRSLQAPWMDVMRMEAVSVLFGLALAAWCLLVSARSRRSFAAQGMIYGSLIAVLVAWPVVSSLLFGRQYGIDRVLNCLNPFFIVTDLARPEYDDAYSYQMRFDLVHASGALPQMLCYLFGTFVLLTWADRTLRFAESDVRFLPGRKSASY